DPHSIPGSHLAPSPPLTPPNPPESFSYPTSTRCTSYDVNTNPPTAAVFIKQEIPDCVENVLPLNEHGNTCNQTQSNDLEVSRNVANEPSNGSLEQAPTEHDQHHEQQYQCRRNR